MENTLQEQHTSQRYNAELEGLRSSVLTMGGLVEQQCRQALEALVKGDEELARTVARSDHQVNEMELEISAQCTDILARRQPAARDLRMVVAIIRMVANLERIGDEAAKVGRMARKLADGRDRESYCSEPQHLGQGASDMLRGALDAFARLDVDGADDRVAPGPVPVGALLDSQSRASGGLRPEQIDSYELGYLYENPAERFALDVRAFEETIDDGIIWFLQALPGGVPGSMDCQLIPDSGLPCGTSRDFVNGARLKIRGIEYQAKWQPLDSTKITVNQAVIDTRAQFTRPDRTPLPSVEYQLEHLTRSAPRRATTIIVQRGLAPNLDLFASWFYVARQKSSPGAETPEYRRLDWRLAYRFNWQGTRGELAYTVQSDGRRHVERKGNALLIPGATAQEIEGSDWLNPRAWLSVRLEY